MALTLIMILCRILLKNTQFRQSKEKQSLYVGFEVMSVFLEMRRLILLQKVACLSLSDTALKSPASELLPHVTKLISEKWQKSWNNCTGNKLQSINPTIGVYQHVRSLSHRDAVIIHRLRIGHTRLTHSYLLSGTDQPECSACHCPLTVKHILIECPALISSRNKHFTASSMKDLFDNVAARNIINFIKESHFYSTVRCCYHIFYISFKP